MKDVSVSELRARLPEFIRLANRKGPIRITSRGMEVGRLVPAQDSQLEARTKLEGLRKKAEIGDMLSPVLGDWDVLE